MRGRLDRPVTEAERQAAIDPFAAWGGYAPATSDPRTRYYTRANIHTDYLRSRELAQGADARHPVPRSICKIAR